mgnify:CR=1 FL=1
MGDVIVSMEHITKEFPGVKALDDVKFNLRSGEVMALLGENGAGKSTLLNIIGGLDQADTGEIIINGKSSADFKQSEIIDNISPACAVAGARSRRSRARSSA